MKATVRITFVCLAAVISLVPRPIGAASDTARDLDQITADRDKAIANAAEPINRIYQTALEALQQRATQANDLDTALRIKQALERLSARVEILGTWNFVNHADGVRYVADFKADNTFFWDGRQVGVWDTDGKKIIVTHYNRGGHSDYFSLPVRDGKLDGSNTHGDKVTITRKAPSATPSSAPRDPSSLGVPAEAKSFNGKWYHVYLEEMGWDAAKQKCSRLGGQLVVIPDEDTWTFVKELAGTASLWIGLSDEGKSSVWEWVDGTPVTFTAWLKNQPDHGEGGQEHYVHTRAGGWNDAVRTGRIDDRNSVVGFICEWTKK